MAPSMPELFPEQRSVFCRLARRVNLEERRRSQHGHPVCAVPQPLDHLPWLCGLRGASTSNSLAQMEEKLRFGIEKALETQGGLSNGRVRKRNIR